MPVASAMATEKANATATGAGWPEFTTNAVLSAGVATNPEITAPTANTMNATVIAAKTMRPK